jgi:hypothetical protein
MAVTGILSGLFGIGAAQGVQTAAQKLKQEFQQLGQDLAAGNLSAAQTDFSALQQGRGLGSGSPSGTTGSTGSTTPSATTTAAGLGGNVGNPVAQAFQQLAQDLKAGNLSAAQSDFSTLQQDLQGVAGKSPAGPVQREHQHHRLGGSGGANGGGGGNSGNPISTLFSQLGQALQAGNLTAAQTAYGTLQADFAQFSQEDGLSTETGLGTSSGTSTGSGVGGVSFDA